MKKIYVNSDIINNIKPMHAVNNGPVYKFHADQRITNMDSWQVAGIPFARTHDSSFYNNYGAEHTVDISAVFPNFDCDENNPDSYDFEITDEYLKVIEYGGTKVFYRLGSKIEHWSKKYNTLPPKDFAKWARICEHIIRHYTEGWANGFKMDIEYWEIWNEPDGSDGVDNKTTWGGTREQFFDFYETAAKHLKKCFPHLKIGGPAIAWREDWAEDFLDTMNKRNVPIDFFSWHSYCADLRNTAEKGERIRKIMDNCGYENAESICNEWNYVKGWTSDEWIYSLRAEKGLKGSSFIAGTMCDCQNSSVDMLMYYDARPCSMNGMFATDIVCDILKGYYPFRMWNELYKRGGQLQVTCDEDIYACAAKGDDGSTAVILTYYNDDDSLKPVSLDISVDGVKGKAKVYLLDNSRDMELVSELETVSGKLSATLEMSIYSTYLIVI